MILQMARLTMGVLALSLMSAPFCSAVPFFTQLTFNELAPGEEALNFYNAGLGSLGTGPGPSLGVTFTPDFMTTNTGINLPDFRVLRSELLTGPSGTMNILGGFNGSFSFYYVANQSGSARLFSGLNGAGTLVGTIPLPVIPSTIWYPAGGTLGPFQSVVFTGTGLAIDNVTFGALVIPEPFPAALLLAGFVFFLMFVGLGRIRRAAGERFSCSLGRLVPLGSAWPH